MKKLFKVILFIICITVLLYILVRFLKLIHFKCIFNELFGIYCAGCGTTRMFESLFRLEFYQAFRYNPLMFILLIVGLIYMGYNVYLYMKCRSLRYPRLREIVVIVVILFIYMILRNIRGFEVLLPTKI